MSGPDLISPKPIGIWIRVSTEDQAKGESPEHHEARARMYAEARGWVVREVYHLEAVSGKSVMAHPECQRMLADIRSGRIAALVFSKLARLARNTRELLDFADIFRDCSADLVSLQEAIDTSTPAGRLFYTMIAAMAQWEREEISSRVAASVPIRARLGKPISGAAPFGYQWKDKVLQPHPQEAPVRKLVYELFLEHKRLGAVARLLNERGYRTRNGSAFTDTTIRRLIEDPTAKGTRRANYTQTAPNRKAWQLKPESEWVLVPVEAIITEDLWIQANALLAARAGNGRPKGRPPVQLFSGIVVCHCGEKMYVPSNSPKYICWGCRTKIGVGDLEAVFQEQLHSFLLSPEEIAGYLAQADETIRAREETVRTLEAESRDLMARMTTLTRAYTAGELPMDAYGREYRPLDERYRQITDELPRLQAELDFLKIQTLSQDEVLSEATTLRDRWPTLTPEEKRQIVEALVQQVVIGKGEVEITLHYQPSPAEIATKSQRGVTSSSRRPA